MECNQHPIMAVSGAEKGKIGAENTCFGTNDTVSSDRQLGPTPCYIHVPVNVPANVPVNKRQLWFLEQLKQGMQCKPADIVAHCGGVEKTAKRDISDLQRKGLVKFEGAPKTGVYQLIETAE